jgi:hypothetical protein
VQTHAEHKRGLCRLVTGRLGHRLLKLDSRAQRINGTAELDQGTVAGQPMLILVSFSDLIAW